MIKWLSLVATKKTFFYFYYQKCINLEIIFRKALQMQRIFLVKDSSN